MEVRLPGTLWCLRASLALGWGERTYSSPSWVLQLYSSREPTTQLYFSEMNELKALHFTSVLGMWPLWLTLTAHQQKWSLLYLVPLLWWSIFSHPRPHVIACHIHSQFFTIQSSRYFSCIWVTTLAYMTGDISHLSSYSGVPLVLENSLFIFILFDDVKWYIPSD